MTPAMAMSYKKRRASKTVTVRVPAAQLEKLMRARKVATHSELINALLTEEEERLKAETVLRETTGVPGGSNLHDRLL